jgi:hypothetical protein
MHGHAYIGVRDAGCVRGEIIVTAAGGGQCDLHHSSRAGSGLFDELASLDPAGLGLPSFGSGILEVLMQNSYLLAATAALLLTMQTPLALAQSAPPAGGTATPPATSAAPAATTTAPSATTDSSSQPTDARKSASKKPAKKKMTRQQEIDHSIDTGTVPARYRSSVPKQYQQYIPFDKR